MEPCRGRKPSGADARLFQGSEYITRALAARRRSSLRSGRGHRAQCGQNAQPELLRTFVHVNRTRKFSLIFSCHSPKSHTLSDIFQIITFHLVYTPQCNESPISTPQSLTRMKQLLQNIKNGKSIVEDVPIPTPRAGQALVKTEASLVSAGTERMVVEFAEKSLVGKARSRPDLVKQIIDKARREGVLNTAQSALNRLDQPMALGYSSAGTILALGNNTQGFNVGQRVACAGGGFAVHAEYAVVPRNLLTPIPDNLDFESAAFTTLGAIALHGFRLAEPQIGESVAVIGLGLVGLLAAQIATAAGCNVLGIDLDADRIALAASLG